MICQNCNEETERKNNRQKYCPDCSVIVGKVHAHAEYLKNSEKIKRYSAEYYQSHREHADALNRQYHSQHPEQRLMDTINQRINNPNQENYYLYGGKGIKNLLSMDDLKLAMLFYGYAELKLAGLKPQIHRKNSEGNYELINICFLPASEHSKLTSKLRKERKHD